MPSTPFDKTAYLARIGLPPVADDFVVSEADSFSFLQRVVAHHRQAIPFENLALCRVFPIDPAHVTHATERISVDRVVQKLVTDRRGGYCYEQNTLLALALRAFGYDVDTLLSRMTTVGASEDRPRVVRLKGLNHMILLVRLHGARYLCDVGFGGRGQPPAPLVLDETPIVETPGGEVYQLRQVAIQRVISSATPALGDFVVVDKSLKADDDPIMWAVYYQTQNHGECHASYVFSTAYSVAQADISNANWKTSTSPTSILSKVPVVVKRTDAGLFTLHDKTFKHIEHGQVVESRIVDSHDELIVVLRDTFGLHAPILD
ncbi:Aste57867_15521 [Aphanomyces stellatus]|uniref:Aste57867_15521 protein n=1 Tax=Aphanomyces stellatus TaxID=120398 RepID=A0A485L573_9STRA|nr:hypothetical protein As57867_015465 [Aphanomyces stellatus]VFT92323.1 Aste57867_15521 [Aphanomyces stellatus]